MEIYIMNGQGGTGKALCNSETVPTPQGRKFVKDIKVGDYLFDAKGNPTKVLGVYPQGEKEVYEIVFKDGRKIRCCEDHLWNVHKKSWNDKDKYKTYTTKQIIEEGIKDKDGRQGYNFSIPKTPIINYKEKEFKIDPYIIGAFLGDGCCLQKQLTLSSNDEEIVAEIDKLLGNHGHRKRSEEDYSWYFFKDKTLNINNTEVKYYQTKELFKEFIAEICTYSYNKSIPNIYKTGSVKQRFNLLQGLFDTDGSIDQKGHVRFTSTSFNLIKDVQEVLYSLGISSTIHEDIREQYTNGIFYNLTIITYNGNKSNLFRLNRKKNIALNLPTTIYTYDKLKIVEINKLNYKEEMTCFYVDNEEHLFLAGDYIVTHNTTFQNMVKEKLEQRHKKVGQVSMVTWVKKIATAQFGWNESDKSPEARLMLHRLKIMLDDWNNSPFKSVCQYIELAASTGCDLIFVDAREPKDIDALKKKYPDAITVLVVREEKKDYGNDADNGVFDYSYDMVIHNTSDLNNLNHLASVFVDKIA